MKPTNRCPGAAGTARGVGIEHGSESHIHTRKGAPGRAITIRLTDGSTAMVSPCDAGLASEYRWRPGGTDGRYVVSLVKEDGRLRTRYLHRTIIGAGPGDIVDHINGDPRDNRRNNLRFVTASQNNVNRSETASGTGFRCVAFYPKKRRWQARVTAGREVFRGPFRASPEAAAHDADALLRGLFGEVASFNFPRPGERGVRRKPDSPEAA